MRCDKLLGSCHLHWSLCSYSTCPLWQPVHTLPNPPPLTWCDCPAAGQWWPAWVYLQTPAARRRRRRTERWWAAAPTPPEPTSAAAGPERPAVLGPSAQSACGQKAAEQLVYTRESRFFFFSVVHWDECTQARSQANSPFPDLRVLFIVWVPVQQRHVGSVEDGGGADGTWTLRLLSGSRCLFWERCLEPVCGAVQRSWGGGKKNNILVQDYSNTDAL